jgi:tRNA (cmo5U34)-methyltransferase
LGLGCRTTFEDEAKDYDNTLYLLPRYDAVMDTIMAHIDFPKDSSIRVLDLGCGTGTLTQRILSAFPKASIYAVDFSPAMLAVAKDKLRNDSRVNFIEKNIFEIIEDEFPFFDLIVSTFVLHNYEGPDIYKEIFNKINNMLAIGGQLIYGDLIQSVDENMQSAEKEIQVKAMKANNLSNEEIAQWLDLLDKEDSPLQISEIETCLVDVGFENLCIKQIGMTAVFSALHPLDILQVKAELLVRGIKESPYAIELYKIQNPGGSPKTGNNGIFTILDNKIDVLISFLHSKNQISPYYLYKENNTLYLTKNEKMLDIKIGTRIVPEWYSTKIDNHTFSDSFLYEGEKYLHIAYKCCDIKDEMRCKFCSVSRRDIDTRDKSADEICEILEPMLQHGSIPDNFHFCLGGGTYLPLKQNVQFFKDIAECINKNRHGKNPIWVEMIPPSKDEIKELIEAGVTSFGFNIEVFDEKLRQKYCPGKYNEATIQTYLDAFDSVRSVLGENKVGSCLITGLDEQTNIKKAIDVLIEHYTFPCILPLKIFDGSAMDLSHERLNFLERDFITLSRYAANKAKQKGLDISQNEGCMNCPCCTIIHDMLKY